MAAEVADLDIPQRSCAGFYLQTEISLWCLRSVLDQRQRTLRRPQALIGK